MIRLPIAKKYDFKNPVGFSAPIALIGFILAGLQALILPLNALVHNTYYVVGHFHLMIWTIIVVGYVAILLDMLQTKMGTLMQLSDIGKGMVFGGLGLWIIRALGAGYTMSYAGYEGLIRRWVSYPPYFQSFMDAISYFAMIMGISFAMYVIPVLFTLPGVGANVVWVRSEAPSLPTGTNITMILQIIALLLRR